MPYAIQEIGTQVVADLGPTERLRLAVLNLNGLVLQNAAVPDDSDNWTEQG